jgi:hypothetical protein
VAALSRPRALAVARAAVFGGQAGATPLRILAGLNVLLAAAVMISAGMHHGELPILSWLAPGILGAFAVSIQYLAVFARYCPARHDPVEGWGETVATLILLTQVSGLVMLWV